MKDDKYCGAIMETLGGPDNMKTFLRMISAEFCRFYLVDFSRHEDWFRDEEFEPLTWDMKCRFASDFLENELHSVTTLRPSILKSLSELREMFEKSVSTQSAKMEAMFKKLSK